MSSFLYVLSRPVKYVVHIVVRLFEWFFKCVEANDQVLTPIRILCAVTFARAATLMFSVFIELSFSLSVAVASLLSHSLENEILKHTST